MIRERDGKSVNRPLLGLGTVVVDHQVVMKQLPEPDTKGEVLSDRFQVGGPVPTALALLQRWGWETEFVGKWSTDEWGRMIEEDLERSGVSVGAALVYPQYRTGFAHVWVEQETGRRSIAAYRGSHEITEDDIAGICWGDYGALHLDGWSTPTAIAAATCMNDLGRPVFIDLGSPKPDWESLVARAHHVNCPRRLLERLFGREEMERSVARILKLGTGSVTVTDGENGSWLFGPTTHWHQPAFAVDVVDTNGAGDVFSGAMIHGLLQGEQGEPLLRWASAAAALKCGQLGNRNALPSLSRVRSFLGETH